MKTILELLESSSPNDNSKGFNKLLKKQFIRNPELKIFLHNKNRQLVGDFLLNYEYFTSNNISAIHQFILQNLSNTDKLFVSDLIDFAVDYQLPIPVRQCYCLLERFGDDDDYPQISFLNYLLVNKPAVDCKKLERLLNNIIDNKRCSIYAQLRASILLYELNQKKRYVFNVIAYTQIDDACKILLDNILSNIQETKIHRAYGSILNQISKDRLTLIYPISNCGLSPKQSSLILNSYK